MGGEPPAEEKPAGPEALRAALEMVAAYQESEEDDIDLADAEKIRTMIQTLLAKQQKEQEAAMGTTPALKGMKRAMSAGG
jgi:predicted glycosyltransferase